MLWLRCTVRCQELGILVQLYSAPQRCGQRFYGAIYLARANLFLFGTPCLKLLYTPTDSLDMQLSLDCRSRQLIFAVFQESHFQSTEPPQKGTGQYWCWNAPHPISNSDSLIPLVVKPWQNVVNLSMLGLKVNILKLEERKVKTIKKRSRKVEQ